jgi:hypothetical protein
MHFTNEEIKAVLLENYDAIAGLRNEDDIVAEYADSFVPVYNNEVMKDWVQLPLDRSDKWKELGYDANKNEGGILRLMQMDLIFYYLEETDRIWQEIKDEKELANAE